MKLLREMVEDMKGKTIKVRYGFVPGGRAGNEYHSGTARIPMDPQELEDAMDDGEAPELMPNDGNLKKMLTAVRNGKMFSDWDRFGEGVFAVSATHSAKDIKLKTLEQLHK